MILSAIWNCDIIVVFLILVNIYIGNFVDALKNAIINNYLTCYMIYLLPVYVWVHYAIKVKILNCLKQRLLYWHLLFLAFWQSKCSIGGGIGLFSLFLCLSMCYHQGAVNSENVTSSIGGSWEQTWSVYGQQWLKPFI